MPPSASVRIDRLSQLFDDAAPVVEAGRNNVELPTRSGSLRWGLSANLRPAVDGVALLDALTGEVLDVLGELHWPTGSAASSHLTLRPLEPHRGRVPGDDPTLARYTAALGRAVAGTPPIEVELGRVGLTRNCVLVEARFPDDAGEQLHRRCAHELGDDAWFQQGVVRDLWYVSLVHFAAPVARGRELVEWVRARADDRPRRTTCDRAQIIQWELADGVVAPTVLSDVALRGDPDAVAR